MIRVRQSLSHRELQTPKTRNSIRDVKVGANVTEALRLHREHVGSRSAFVFSNREGKAHDAANLVKRTFNPALERAGLRRIRWHDLRHTYASLMLNLGCNIKYLSCQMGHASVQITLDRYAHLIPEQHDATVDAVDALAHCPEQREANQFSGVGAVDDIRDSCQPLHTNNQGEVS